MSWNKDAWQGLTTNLLTGSEDQRNDQEIQENTKQTSYKIEKNLKTAAYSTMLCNFQNNIVQNRKEPNHRQTKRRSQ